jgi:hypothetical protein
VHLQKMDRREHEMTTEQHIQDYRDASTAAREAEALRVAALDALRAAQTVGKHRLVKWAATRYDEATRAAGRAAGAKHLAFVAGVRARAEK